MELTGKVKLVGEEISVSAAYTKRQLVITTEEQYPQVIDIEFPQGKCNKELDELQLNQQVKVHINVGGREWVNPEGETKYFNSIKGWRIEILQPLAVPGAAPANQKYVHTATDATYEAYKQATWTDQQLVDNGKGRWEAVAVPAAAPASAPAIPAAAPAMNFEPQPEDLPF